MSATPRTNALQRKPHYTMAEAVSLATELEQENTKLRAAIRAAVPALNTDPDLDDEALEQCHDEIKRRRAALRHCEAALG